jgi:hypothetical protein
LGSASAQRVRVEVDQRHSCVSEIGKGPTGDSNPSRGHRTNGPVDPANHLWSVWSRGRPRTSCLHRFPAATAEILSSSCQPWSPGHMMFPAWMTRNVESASRRTTSEAFRIPGLIHANPGEMGPSALENGRWGVDYGVRQRGRRKEQRCLLRSVIRSSSVGAGRGGVTVSARCWTS